MVFDEDGIPLHSTLFHKINKIGWVNYKGKAKKESRRKKEENLTLI
jgi:hypothetical protein